MDEKGIYTASVEIKKLMGLVKRRANRKEVTKDTSFHPLLLILDPNLEEYINTYMASVSCSSAASSTDDGDDNWNDEDEETRQDFNEFKTWLEQQGEVPKVVSPRRNRGSQETAPACNLCKKDLRECKCKQQIAELKAKIAQKKLEQAERDAAMKSGEPSSGSTGSKQRAGSKDDLCETLPLEAAPPLAPVEEPNEPEVEIPAAQVFMLTSPASPTAKEEEVVEPEPSKVLTRAMQRSKTKSMAKPAACIKDENGNEVDTEMGDQGKNSKDADAKKDKPLAKRPAANISPKSKPERKTKAKAKGKAKAKSSPKKRAKQDKFNKNETTKSEEEPVFTTPKRQLFQESDPDEENENEEDMNKDKEKKHRKTKPDPEAKAKAKGKAKAKAKSKTEQKEDPKEEPPAKKPRRTRRKADLEETTDSQRFADDVMKALFLQVLKDTKPMVIEDMKKYLAERKPTLSSGNVGLNVYWTKASSACRLLCVSAPYPDAAYFNFKQGTWNMRMSAAFMASVLMASWMDQQPTSVLQNYEDVSSEFAEEKAKIKFNAVVALEQHQSSNSK